MACLRITGGVPLGGSVAASGSKNAALPIMAACILAAEPVTLGRVPDLVDVNTLALLLGHLGLAVKRQTDDTLRIDTVDPTPIKADYRLVRRMRASFCVLGPLLARRGRAVVSLPGGCNIGTRPVDLHLRGLAALGAELRIEHGYVIASARRLRGAQIDLGGPHGPTVTGTANVMSAAVLASGQTVITSAAREPELVDLGHFLNRLGARISGLGSDTIEVTGVDQLGGGRHEVIADRIETATLLLAAAITGGSVRVNDTVPAHLAAVLDVLGEAGCRVDVGRGDISLRAPERPRPFDIIARPYPGIPTDLQAQFVALATVGAGRSRVRDAVFPERFMHVAELCRLGARIERQESTAVIRGVERLSGAEVTACDLRASAALVLAALRAEGDSIVQRAQHLDRGYERLDQKLARCGAMVERDRGTRPAAAVRRERPRVPR
ncbi:MAG: UDP-N-acetylglucosamine 1-carboxyvinyltransferase [Pirellulales bacterium]